MSIPLQHHVLENLLLLETRRGSVAFVVVLSLCCGGRWMCGEFCTVCLFLSSAAARSSGCWLCSFLAGNLGTTLVFSLDKAAFHGRDELTFLPFLNLRKVDSVVSAEVLNLGHNVCCKEEKLWCLLIVMFREKCLFSPNCTPVYTY